jgi:glycosyltransferase involved in cell wall biosynthesis
MTDLRVAFITDINTPYMAPVFEALAARCQLIVLFGAGSGSRGMGWSLDEPTYRHRVVGGPTIRRRADAADIYPTPRVLQELWRARPAVVVSGGFSFPSLYAAAYCRSRRARLLIQSDGTSRSEAPLGPDQRLTRAILARLAHGAVGNSSAAVDRLAELGFARVFAAPHTTNVDRFLAVGRQRELRPDGPLRVVAVGRLLENKGIDLLLHAAAATRGQGVQLELTIVGEGADEARLRRLAADLGLTDVCWRGFVQPQDLPEELARADALAFPTLGDTFGIVLLEAAAAGLPLIASPYAGATRDLVHGTGTGVVVDPRDTTAFASALVDLARDPERRARMGRAGHELARHRTPAATADTYLEAITAVGRT